MVNFGFLYFLGGCLLLTLVGGLIYLIWLNTKQKDEPSNDPISVNLMSSYSNGYGLGLLENQKSNEDRIKADFLPRDINYEKLGKGIALLPPKIIIKKEFHIPLGNSTHRQIFLDLPPNSEELNDTIKNHPFGQYIMQYIEDQSQKTEFSEILRKRLKNQNKILTQTEGLDIVQDFMTKVKEKESDAQPTNLPSKPAEKP